jgi:hypothetical protein
VLRFEHFIDNAPKLGPRGEGKRTASHYERRLTMARKNDPQNAPAELSLDELLAEYGFDLTPGKRGRKAFDLPTDTLNAFKNANRPVIGIKCKPLGGEKPESEFTGKFDIEFEVTTTSALSKNGPLIAWCNANGYVARKNTSGAAIALIRKP